jgi:hypothetical protein
MSRNIKLKNIEKYREINTCNSFSLYDYIYHEIALSKVSTDIYFALLELYWPNFVLYEGFVFLKEKLTEIKFNSLDRQSDNVEYWLNFLTIDGYFENDENGEEKAEALSKILVEIWSTKLKKDFPQLDFVVLYLEDKEFGDYGLTFYQKKYEAKESKNSKIYQ